jgi:hypothetical protein
MTYNEVVTLVSNIAATVNTDGAFFHGRTFDTTLEFGSLWPQIHLYPFTQTDDLNNGSTNKSDLLIGFWKPDGHENTMEQREEIISDMDELSRLFTEEFKKSSGIQIISLRREPQYLTQMGVASGVAVQLVFNSKVSC